MLQGSITITLTQEERMACCAALATQAQVLRTADSVLARDVVATTWKVLAALYGDSVTEVQQKFGVLPPTRADVARHIAECEIELAKQRTQGHGQ